MDTVVDETTFLGFLSQVRVIFIDGNAGPFFFDISLSSDCSNCTHISVRKTLSMYKHTNILINASQVRNY